MKSHFMPSKSRNPANIVIRENATDIFQRWFFDTGEICNSKKPALEVCCPYLQNATFKKLKSAVRDIVEIAKWRADKKGYSIPLVILFSENALGYRYNVQSCISMLKLEHIAADLPQDMWIALALNVMEIRKGLPSNTGYLVSSQEIYSAPKRKIADGDAGFVGCIRYLGIDSWKAWRSRGSIMEFNKEPFPNFITPNGVKIEHRVCLDSTALPMENEPNTVTLVSAFGLDFNDLARLSHFRRALIVHDGNLGGDRYGAIPGNAWISDRPSEKPALEHAGVFPYLR